MSQFEALFVEKEEEKVKLAYRAITEESLPAGDVTISVHYSGINYKDALAASPNGNIVRNYPFIPGIDAAGTIIHSEDTRFQAGDQVIVTSYELGVSHFGGYSEQIRVPGDWVVPLPEGMSLKEAMSYGTAGFTAALSVEAIINHGIRPEDGKIAVSGASGGVGSIATAILAKLGYTVVASSGKKDAEPLLKKLGAAEIVDRSEFAPAKIKALGKQAFAASLDCVGGDTLAYLISSTNYDGIVTTCGMAASGKLNTTVFPFILRGVTLKGIDSVYCPMEKRLAIWKLLASTYHIDSLAELTISLPFHELPPALSELLNGNSHLGRYVVEVKPSN